MSEIFLGQVYMVHIEGTQNLYYHYNSLNTNNIHFLLFNKRDFSSAGGVFYGTPPIFLPFLVPLKSLRANELR